MRDNETAVLIEPPGEATASVIWLHGLGADGNDFAPVVPELGEAIVRSTRFVFPHAPHMPVTINGGMVMRAWYDIADVELDRRADESGVRASEARLRELIQSERERGLASERIVLAGFSQGGAIALHTGLRHPERLAGIMALSTYLPLAESARREAQAANRDVPIFMAHGSQDPVIPLALSERSRRFMRELGYDVECHTYPMPHSVCAEELRDIACWLERVLGVEAGDGDARARG